MKPGKCFAVAVAVLLVVSVIWVFLVPRPDTPSAGQAAESVPESRQAVVGDQDQTVAGENETANRASPSHEAQTEQKPVAHVATQASRLATMREAENAVSAVDRRRALERLAEIEPTLAARKLLELAQFCGAQYLDAREQLGDPPWLLERRRAWCSGLDLSEQAMQERLRELTRVDSELEGDEARIERMARRPYIGRSLELEEGIASAPERRRSDRFTRLVRQAVDFEELATLAAMNRQHAEESGGRPLWELGVELQQRIYPQAELMEAQWLAIMLYGCRRLGGCGPGQYITMTACTVGWVGRCAAGTSLEEQIYLTTAPATYELALEILARI